VENLMVMELIRGVAVSDESLYQHRLSAQESEWEALCRNCGACCGAFEDPCEHLKMSADGKSSCAVYADRFGLHRTVSGEPLRCIPIREKLGMSWPGDERCGYKRVSR